MFNNGKVDTAENRGRLQSDLDNLGDWSLMNEMPFNVNKCKVIHVGKKNVNMDYKLMGLLIPKAKEEKDLGMFFSDKFKPSCSNKASKAASKVIGLIIRNIVHKGS